MYFVEFRDSVTRKFCFLLKATKVFHLDRDSRRFCFIYPLLLSVWMSQDYQARLARSTIGDEPSSPSLSLFPCDSPLMAH